MCKGDLPRRREGCHLGEEGTQSQIGDTGVGRDVGRGHWPERPLHQQLVSGNEEQPEQAHAHRADLPACLSQGSPGHASPPCPAVGSHGDHCFQPCPKPWLPSHATSHEVTASKPWQQLPKPLCPQPSSRMQSYLPPKVRLDSPPRAAAGNTVFRSTIYPLEGNKARP